MKRSTYSLILMDDVVAAVDRLAVQKGMSRSNLINQILAQQLCCTTPEQQMQQLFDGLTAHMDETFRIAQQGSQAMLSVFGVLQYKYRPTVRYTVELLREPLGAQIGTLRISCRTTSSGFLGAMDSFFRLWAAFEQRHRPEGAIAQGLYLIEPGRMSFALLSDERSAEECGSQISYTIDCMHRLLQTYLSGLSQELPHEVLVRVLEKQYLAQRDT